MIRGARQIIVLLDHTAVGAESLVKVTPLESIDRLITDKGISAPDCAALAQQDVEITVADGGGVRDPVRRAQRRQSLSRSRDKEAAYRNHLSETQLLRVSDCDQSVNAIGGQKMHTLSSRIQFLVALVVILSLVLAACAPAPAQPAPAAEPAKPAAAEPTKAPSPRRQQKRRRLPQRPQPKRQLLLLLPTMSAARPSSLILMAAASTLPISGIPMCPEVGGIMGTIRP